MSTIKTTTLSTQGGSTVPVDTVVNGTAKAWVNFNGTGTVAIRRAFNVSSITDNSSGNFTANFTAAMVDSNFVTLATAGDAANAGSKGMFGVYDNTATSSSFVLTNYQNTIQDKDTIMVAIFS